MTATPTVQELATFLGQDVDTARGQLLIDLAGALAESVVTPLPDPAKTVVLSVSARMYTTPPGVTAETIGPVSVQHAPGGMYLTKAERTTLYRLAGRGGAFTVDPTPLDAAVPIFDSDAWAAWSSWARDAEGYGPGGLAFIPSGDDFDVPPQY